MNNHHLIEVIREVQNIGSQYSQPLTQEQRAWALHVGVRNVDDVSVWELDDILSLVPNQLGAIVGYAGILTSQTVGLTLDHLILVKRGYLTERLLRHELRHVYQWERYSEPVDYLTEYLGQISRFGYRNAPLEIDARNHER